MVGRGRMLVWVAALAGGCGERELIYETHSSDEAGGAQELTLRGARVRLVEYGGGPKRRSSGDLAPAAIEALAAARAGVTRAIADSVVSCGVADTTTFVYHLEDAQGPFTLAYCDSRDFAPAGAEALVELIGEVVRGLRSCEDNAVVDVRSPCSPG